MANFRRYRVWQRAHELTVLAYRVTAQYPSDERYGLTSQIRRSASSIPTNIAEGLGRSSDKDRARFLDISVGSANELEYQLLLSHELTYLDKSRYDQLDEMLTVIRKMLMSLRTKLRTSSR